MWGRLLWGWGPALTQASSRAMTPASTSMMAVYSGQEVETALLMAAQSLALKNRAIDALHAQLEAVELRLAAAREQRGSGMQDQTRTAEAALAAELAHLQARCQTAELQAATLVKRLADALAVTDRQARDIEAAHERSSAVKRQLAAVKAELAEAKAAQGSAVAALGELEAALAELREESTALRHEKDELQAMLTARESAYLTLLETVQDLFRQHSPSSSGEQTPEENGSQPGDLGERLQLKLREWQQRLQSAAKLRSLSRGGSEAIKAATASLHSFSATAARAGASGGPGSACSTASSGASFGRTASPARSCSSCLTAAQASAVQAAIEAAAHDGTSTSGGGSAGSSRTAVASPPVASVEAASLPAPAQAQVPMAEATSGSDEGGGISSSTSSALIPALRLARAASSQAVPVLASAVPSPPAGSAPRGSRIKQLGLQAASVQEGGQPRPLLRQATSNLPAAASARGAAAAPPAFAAWTPARQASKRAVQPRSTIGSSKAGLARVRGSGDPGSASLASSSVMWRQTSLSPSAGMLAEGIGVSPTADAEGPPAGLTPLMLALAAAARPPSTMAGDAGQ